MYSLSLDQLGRSLKERRENPTALALGFFVGGGVVVVVVVGLRGVWGECWRCCRRSERLISVIFFFFFFFFWGGGGGGGGGGGVCFFCFFFFFEGRWVDVVGRWFVRGGIGWVGYVRLACCPRRKWAVLEGSHSLCSSLLFSSLLLLFFFSQRRNRCTTFTNVSTSDGKAVSYIAPSIHPWCLRFNGLNNDIFC